MSRRLLIGCLLIACEVPDKMPSRDPGASMPGEVPGASHDAQTATADAQSTPSDAASLDAAIPCDDDDDDDDAHGGDCKEPANRCIDDDYLLRYTDAKCIAGLCVYSHEVKYCEDGCEHDKCD